MVRVVSSAAGDGRAPERGPEGAKQGTIDALRRRELRAAGARQGQRHEVAPGHCEQEGVP